MLPIDPTRRRRRARTAGLALRRLLGQRSLWVAVPLVALACAVDGAFWSGPFDTTPYPLSAEYVRRVVPRLLVLVAVALAFCAPAPGRRAPRRPGPHVGPHVGPGAGLAAHLALAIGLAATGILSALVAQSAALRAAGVVGGVDLAPWAAVCGRVVLPVTALLAVVSVAVQRLAPGRRSARAVLLALGAACAWSLARGVPPPHLDPLLIAQWDYSDFTGLAPWGARLRDHAAFFGPVALALLALSAWRSGRFDTGRTALLLGLTGLALGAASLSAALAKDRGLLARERALLALETELLDAGGPRLTYERVDLDVILRPAGGTVDVHGECVLSNPGPGPLSVARFRVDPRFAIRRFELDRGGQPELRAGVLSIPLVSALAPGEPLGLVFDWSGRVDPLDPPTGDEAVRPAFVLPQAALLGSHDPQLLPLPGIGTDLCLRDPARRRAHGRGPLRDLRPPDGPARRARGPVRSLDGADRRFDLALRIDVPREFTVVASGASTGTHRSGDREIHSFASEAPLGSFAIAAGRYTRVERGPLTVLHHPAHGHNVPALLDALEAGMRTFESHFGPPVQRELAMVEVPRFWDSAQAFPGVLAYSEAAGFLADSRLSALPQAPWFVAAHEVAHQWWGLAVRPGDAPGGRVLAESLAEYSALVLLDQHHGPRELARLLAHQERTYLRHREAEHEVPLALLGDGAGELAYAKGSLVLWMLEREIGRERVLTGLRAFAAGSRRGAAANADLPVLEDLLYALERTHPERDLDWFYDQWFREVVTPDARLVSARARPEAGGTWTVEVTAINAGTGRANVRVEAVRGEAGPSGSRGAQGAALMLTLEPGRPVHAVLSAPFEPEAVVLDLGRECLDVDRENNRLELARPGRKRGRQAQSETDTQSQSLSVSSENPSSM